MKKFIVLLALFCATSIVAQVGINTITPDPSSALDIQASDKGILIPRVSLSDVSNTTIDGTNTAATGLLIYNTNGSTTGGSGVGFYFFNGTVWEKLITGSGTEDADFFEIGGTSTPDDINDDIYTLGNVKIGSGTATTDRFYVNNPVNETFSGIRLVSSGDDSGNIGYGVYNQSNVGDVLRFSNYYNAISGSSDALHYMIENQFDNTGSGTKVGLYNEFNFGAPEGIKYGVWNRFEGGDTSVTGVYNQAPGAWSVDGTLTGLDNSLSAGGNGVRYGVRNIINGLGSGTKYGSFNNISNTAGGTHYGVYSDVRKSGSFAGFFIGQVSIGTGAVLDRYLLPGTDGTAGQVMTTDGAGNVTFEDPSGGGTLDDAYDFGGAGAGRIITADNGAVEVQGAGGVQIEGDVYIGDTNATNNDLYISDRIIDWDNSSFYLDPSDESIVNEINYSVGSSTDPSIHFGADNNSGFYRPEEDAIGFTSNAVDKIRFTSKGQIEFYNTGSSVFLGEDAGNNDDLSGRQNTAIGYRALRNNVSGARNIAIGSSAMLLSTGGSTNVAIGDDAMAASTSGSNNVSIGTQTLFRNTTGNNNVALGGTTLRENNVGSNNTALGYRALYNTNANANIGIGYETGFTNSSGTQNTFIGTGAGHLTTGSSNVFLGYNAGYNETTSNKLYIENSNTSNPLIYGEFDNDILRTNGTLQINDPAGSGYSFPIADGSNGQVLITDGSGNLSFGNAPGDTDWVDSGADIERQAGDVYIGDTNATNNDLYISDRIIDWDNSSYYLDPASTSFVNNINLDASSATTPAIQINDTNTGFYSDSPGTVSFTGNGTKRFDILSDGEIQFRGTTATDYDFTTLGTYGNDGISIGSTGSSLPIVSGFIANDARDYILGLEVQSVNSNFNHAAIDASNNIGGSQVYIAYNDGTPTGTYAVYADGGSNYAGYFLGDVSIGTTTTNNYILPASRGTNGQIMETDGAGNVSWVTPSTSVSASNGLTETAGDVALGGTLSQSTTITQGTFDLNLNLNSTGNFIVDTDGLIVENGGNVGFGVTDPVYQLDLQDGPAGQPIANFFNTNTNDQADGIRIQLAATSPNASAYYIEFERNTSTPSGRISGTVTGTGVQYLSASDRRLKTNFKTVKNALNTIENMKPTQYVYKANPSVPEIGFIAQELQNVYPQAVSGNPYDDANTNPMMVDYGRLTPILTAGVQELHQRVKNLEEENSELKKQLAQYQLLEARIKALENK